jgi:hypothetical protein
MLVGVLFFIIFNLTKMLIFLALTSSFSVSHALIFTTPFLCFSLPWLSVSLPIYLDGNAKNNRRWRKRTREMRKEGRREKEVRGEQRKTFRQIEIERRNYLNLIFDCLSVGWHLRAMSSWWVLIRTKRELGFPKVSGSNLINSAETGVFNVL